MMERKVQFSEQAPEVSAARTWPKSALKCNNQPQSLSPAAPSRGRKQKLKAMVIDIYRGYRSLNDFNSSELFHDLVKDPGDNALMSWTVLNMILRTAEMHWQLQQTPELRNEEDSLYDVSVNAKECISLIDRASAHFDVFSQSADVLDSRVLSQIMRTVELLWVSAAREGYVSEISQCIGNFVERCVSLIRTKPSSKSLATIAIRVINLVDWSIISESRISALIKALGKTQLAFATSFAAESVVAYTNAARLHPELMTETQHEWIPVVLRALFANSALTRSQSFTLLSGCSSPEIFVNALNDSTDPGAQSDALARNIARRMLAMIQMTGEEDAYGLMQAWCLIVKAVSEVDQKWPHLDLWFDVAKMAFRTNMNAALSQWDTLLSISGAFNRYELLLYPFNSGIQLTSMQCASLIDSTVKKFRVGESLWDSFLEEVFKTLGQSKNEQYPRMVLQRMENILQPVRLWLGSNTGRVLNVCMIIFRNPVSCPQLCANVWRLLVESAASRPQSMELLRFHYKLLSLDVPVASSLTSILVETWPLKMLTEKAKTTSHSLLSLILLPITSFGSTSGRVEYIEKNVLAHFTTLSDLITVLRVVLSTVTNNESQQSTQLDRWSTVAHVVLNVLSKNHDHGSQAVIMDTASIFVSLFLSTATRREWALWTRLILGLKSPDTVLSKISSLGSNDGFEALLYLKVSSTERIRIIAKSMADSKIIYIRKAAKDGVINSEFVDNVARALTARSKQQVSASTLAVALLSPTRVFVIAKPLLEVISETRSMTLITLWNNKVLPSLSNCPPFVSEQQQMKLARDIPVLRLPDNIIMDRIVKREPETPLSSVAKRPRRRILTGSVPPSLSTPPPSSDPIEDNLPSSADELSSSPPRNIQLPMPSWQNSQERARVLKRVIMGLNMQDAMQGMKRSECEMIYNLLFRACVDLHTHLSDTAPPKPNDEVNDARDKLQQVLELRQKQEEHEIEEARLRQIKREAEDESEEDEMQDDELSDFVNDDDDEDYNDNDDDVYLSGKRQSRGSPILSVAERTLRLKT